jgi:hypothetical protein
VIFLPPTGSALGVAVLSTLRPHSSASHADALQPEVDASNREAVAALGQLASGLTEDGPGPVEAAATSEKCPVADILRLLSDDSLGLPDAAADSPACSVWEARSIEFHRSPQGRFDPVPLSFEAWGNHWAPLRTTGWTCVEKD